MIRNKLTGSRHMTFCLEIHFKYVYKLFYENLFFSLKAIKMRCDVELEVSITLWSKHWCCVGNFLPSSTQTAIFI
jgi:hypothetical protein